MPIGWPRVAVRRLLRETLITLSLGSFVLIPTKSAAEE